METCRVALMHIANQDDVEIHPSHLVSCHIVTDHTFVVCTNFTGIGGVHPVRLGNSVLYHSYAVKLRTL